MLGQRMQKLWINPWWTRPTLARQWRSALTLNAAQFAHILEASPTPTEAAYMDDPLAKMTVAQRGRIFQRVSLHALAAMRPKSKFSKAPAGLCLNGQRRNRHQSEHDLKCDGRNVECKGTTMRWDTFSQRWDAMWLGIKFHQKVGSIDDLVLSLHSPGRVDVLLHDLTSYVSHHGVRTRSRGHSVCVNAGQGLVDPAQACENIRRKLLSAGASLQMATWDTHSALVAEFIHEESKSEAAEMFTICYRDVPLSQKTPTSRALCLQRLAFEVDHYLHPRSSLQYGFGKADLVGVKVLMRRGPARARADWLRDNVRVEFKSSKLSWNRANSCWLVCFAGIKYAHASEGGSAAYDDLLLGIYSPLGLHLLRYAGNVGLSTQGVGTTIEGYHRIVVQGPSREEDIAAALQVILGKLKAGGCEALAMIRW